MVSPRHSRALPLGGAQGGPRVGCPCGDPQGLPTGPGSILGCFWVDSRSILKRIRLILCPLWVDSSGVICVPSSLPRASGRMARVPWAKRSPNRALPAPFILQRFPQVAPWGLGGGGSLEVPQRSWVDPGFQVGWPGYLGPSVHRTAHCQPWALSSASPGGAHFSIAYLQPAKTWEMRRYTRRRMYHPKTNAFS